MKLSSALGGGGGGHSRPSERPATLNCLQDEKWGPKAREVAWSFHLGSPRAWAGPAPWQGESTPATTVEGITWSSFSALKAPPRLHTMKATEQSCK